MQNSLIHVFDVTYDVQVYVKRSAVDLLNHIICAILVWPCRDLAVKSADRIRTDMTTIPIPCKDVCK